MAVKSLVARKAAKAAVTHSAHGVVSKVERKPFRSVTLLGVGALVGFVVAKLTQKDPLPPPHQTPPPPPATVPPPAPVSAI